ncbi:MAG: thioredoxin family protein [Deltaproteobacteria bacterium]|nr:thioredoxin family protein [Myxococcales bacterium]MDP3216183.1 thioredoxin family protein [Deltaproteobacteria bacterium]
MPDHPSVHDATSESFDALVFAPRGELVVVDFWGDGCPNCEVFARDVPALLAELAGEALRVVKVDARAHDDVARRFGLYGIPTFLLVRDGRLLGRMSQYHGRAYWLAVVREHLPAAATPAATPPPPSATHEVPEK